MTGLLQNMPQLQKDFGGLMAMMAANTAVFGQVPAGLAHYEPLVSTMRTNVENYDQVSSLPNFNLLRCVLHASGRVDRAARGRRPARGSRGAGDGSGRVAGGDAHTEPLERRAGRVRGREPHLGPVRRPSAGAFATCAACADTIAGHEARARHRRRRVHPVEPDPPPPRAHRPRGRVAGRAHLRRERREPGRRDEPSAALVRPRRHPRCGARARARGGRGRDRQRRCRVARREVDPRGGVRVRDDERRGHADPARRDPRDAGRAVPPDLLERGLRHGRDRPDGRAPPARAAQPLRGDEGGWRPARLQLLGDLRAAGRDRPPVQQLRAQAASGEGRAPVHHAGAARAAADDPGGRVCQPRLAARGRHSDGDRGADRGSARHARRRGRERRDRTGHQRHGDRRPRARGACETPGRRRCTSTSDRGRSTVTSARPTSSPGSSAGGRRSRFEEGLERTVAWYRENEAWWQGVLGRSERVSSS